MADKTVRFQSFDGTRVDIRAHENGDGSYSLGARPPRYDLSFTNKSADENIVTGQGELGDIFIEAASSGGVIIYDNSAASGTVLFSHTFTAAFTGRIGVTRGKFFSNGIYIDIVGTAKVTGEYRLR